MAKKELIVKGQKEILTRANGTKRVRTINNLPSRTQKHFRELCDVNHIMARYKKTGQITHLRNAEHGTYMDLTNIPDLLTAKIQLQQAEQTFMQIPPDIRQKFQNDPARLISFLADPSNKAEAIKLGLMVDTSNLEPKLETPAKKEEQPAKPA